MMLLDDDGRGVVELQTSLMMMMMMDAVCDE